MEVTYNSTVDGLRETLASTASSDSVEGILLLAAPDEELLSDDFESVLRALDVPIFGGIFPEILYQGDRKDTGALTVGLSTTPDVTTVTDLSDPTTTFRDELDPDLPAKGYETAFVFVDTYATNVEEFIEALFRTYSVELNFLGGGAGTVDGDQRPVLFTNEGVIEDGAVIATLREPIKIGVNHGWQEIAGPFRVTEAEGSTLSTLDGKPAFSVYGEAIGEAAGETVTKKNFFESAKSYLFGISRMAAEQIVRDPYRVAADGSMTCFGEMPEGEFVTVLQGDPDSLVAAAQAAHDHALSGARRPDALCVFDCVSRMLYLDEEFDRELDAVRSETLPLFGALTIGEIANDGSGHLDYYNKTAVVGALSDV
ncbi:FIST-like protein [Halohasta litchfieldiae]|uniref:FIST N domain-containing protein n=1 Tax=Halohasta litchfieldiae TaxID=1073996 RepID=A0A1H6TUV7_9EURY|nr:FIST C-terminal domain-containing protein [Halohasta litchfieldiae]ATW87182.1 FIST-like protein [Halohasta litchfieldiae]SEI83791.1 FIST N domain-containing protein [Halohasta litchfieldiae]